MESIIDTPVHSPRMIISVNAESKVCFKFEAMFVTIADGTLPADHKKFPDLAQSLCPESEYFLCEGIPYEMATLMGYQTKSLRQWDFPFKRLETTIIVICGCTLHQRSQLQDGVNVVQI